MHRTIEITVPPTETAGLLRQLEALDDVIGLSVNPGASVKPRGDVITVHALNKGADDVLRHVAEVGRRGPISIVTAEVASIIDPAQDEAVANDVDEAVWEEMETGLRHQGRITANYLALMALGGAIAAVGLVSEPVPQVLAFVAASIIAPGFEPLVKIPLGLVLRRPAVAWRGLRSVAAGYAILIVAAALAFLLLRLTGSATVADFVHNPEVERIAHPTFLDLLVSACGAIAGVVMVAAYRRSVIAGPLVALILIPAAATIGVALVATEPRLIWEGFQRLALDVFLVIALGMLVLFIKQRTVHRRPPLV